MSKAAHTPTPWQIRYSRAFDYVITSALEDKDIARIDGQYPTLDLMEENEDRHHMDAKIIVTAVNHHQELVTRLYNLVNDAETALGFLRENTPNRNAFSRTEDYREACGDHDTALRALEFRVTEARETLKK